MMDACDIRKTCREKKRFKNKEYCTSSLDFNKTNHMYVMSIFFFFPDTFIRNLDLCHDLVSHFVTLTEDSAAPSSQRPIIVVERFEEVFCIMEESTVSVLCLCLCVCVCVCTGTRLVQ
jgi:hypothetical protein